MGTRALVVLQEPDNTELVVIYSQWDGYPTGLGKELGKILGKYEVGNGIPGGKVFTRPFSNGMAELGIHLICELKKREWEEATKTSQIVAGSRSYPLPQDQYPAQIGHKPGGYYLYPAGTRDCGEEWLYFVRAGADGKVWIKVARAEKDRPDGKEMWEGLASELALSKTSVGIE